MSCFCVHSLRGGVERLTFSVLWEMTPDAHILSSRFTKGLIRSRAALTYADAQACIDDASRNDDVAQVCAYVCMYEEKELRDACVCLHVCGDKRHCGRTHHMHTHLNSKPCRTKLVWMDLTHTRIKIASTRMM